MHVMAALDVEIIGQDHLDMGINRDGLVMGLVASRSAVTQDIARKMNEIGDWKARRAVYPIMLKECLSALDGMQ